MPRAMRIRRTFKPNTLNSDNFDWLDSTANHYNLKAASLTTALWGVFVFAQMNLIFALPARTSELFHVFAAVPPLLVPLDNNSRHAVRVSILLECLFKDFAQKNCLSESQTQKLPA